MDNWTSEMIRNEIALKESQLHPMRRERDANLRPGRGMVHEVVTGPNGERQIIAEHHPSDDMLTDAHIRHLEGCIYAMKVELEKRHGMAEVVAAHPADHESHRTRAAYAARQRYGREQ